MKLKVVTLIWMEFTKDFLFMELVEQWNKCNNRQKTQCGGPKDMIVMVSSTLNLNLELTLPEVAVFVSLLVSLDLPTHFF